MTIYLGPPGNLQALPYMGRGMGAPLDLGASVHRSLGGVRTVDYVGDPKRTYTLERKYLSTDELSVLEGLAVGAYGGDVPMALVDPFRRNMLTPNQSTAGDVERTTAGVTLVGGGSIVQFGPNTAVPQGRYFWTYTSPAAAAAQIARVYYGDPTSAATITTPGGDAPAIPVRAFASYAFGMEVFCGAGSSVAWQAGLRWYTEAGVLVSSTFGTSAVIAAGSWVQRAVTAAAPATAAYCTPFLTNAAILAASDSILIDRAQFAAGSSVGSYVVGSGVPRVAFVGSLDLSYPNVLGENDLGITLQEVS